MTHTIEFVKKRAKKIKKSMEVPHFAALDIVAQDLGFRDYTDFLKRGAKDEKEINGNK